jgi:hypothetical protein
MENFPKLEAAYRAMSKEKRLRLIELALLFAEKWPVTQLDSQAHPRRASHLRVVHSNDTR